MDAALTDFRLQRGLELAQRSAKRIKKVVDGIYVVPSATHTGTYVVNTTDRSCTCPDWETRGVRCKHQIAVAVCRHELTLPDGSVVVTEAAKITYPQEWAAYSRAQQTEKEHVQYLLRGLCSGIQPVKKTGKGRPFLLASDAIYGVVMKVYTGMSARRSSTDIRQCEQAGHISKAPHYNSICNYLERPSVTPILKALVEESAAPLAEVETKFAVDSTGFATSCYRRWFDHKYGKEVSKNIWVKAHCSVGVCTNVVSAVEVTDGFSNDSPEFVPLVKRTAKRFDVREVSADKAYLSHQNLKTVEEIGGTPYVPFKSNSQGEGSQAWRNLWHLYSLHREDFLRKYRLRENSESTFSAVKRLFGANVRSRLPVAMQNEALAKFVAYNLTVLVHSIYTLGIEPKFWLPKSEVGS